MRTALAHLLDCITQETVLLQAFTDQLERESRLLGDLSDMAALEACTRQKQRYAAELAAADTNRDAALARCGLPCGRQGLELAPGLHPDISKACIHLQDLASRAHALNDANGVMIQACMQHYAEAMRDLQRLHDACGLYDARGRSLATGHSPSLRHITG